MTVTLTPEMESLVNDHIACGKFSTPEEVIAASLRLMCETAARKDAELRRCLRRLKKTLELAESHHSIP